MDSGVSCNRKSRNPRCWWTSLGCVRAAAVAPRRFPRWQRCVVKVFGEISDVLSSDAHRIARYRSWIWEIAESAKIPIHPGFSAKSYVFRRSERAKPLQTFSGRTAVRVARSARVLSHYSRSNIRKTSKIKQNSVKKGYKIK